MQGSISSGAEMANVVGNSIGQGTVIRLGADVFQRLTLSIAHKMDMLVVKIHGGQVILPHQAMKPATLFNK